MEHHQSKGKTLAVVGGVTAAATAVGAWVPAANVATAQPDGLDAAVGASGLAQDGTFEACSAYFGFGKEEGVLGVTAFDVADVNGADGVAHAVPTDTDVVLVLENDGGDVIECIPEEITEEDWDDEFEPNEEFNPNMPVWPGPGHYAYPQANGGAFIEDFGAPIAVGFRVAGVPGQHTLVSPTGVKPLPSFFLDSDDLRLLDTSDPRVDALVAAEVSEAAAAAYAEARTACVEEEPYDDEGPDLVAALQFLADFIFGEDTEQIDQVSCDDIGASQALASFVLGAQAAAAHSEPIRLSVPEEPPAAAPAAQPAPAAPTFTG